MENGLRCSGSIPYGYLADKEDKSKYLIDEEAAAVVRRIFQMIIDGKGVNEIGRILRAEQIPIPSEHWKRIGAPVRSVKYTDPYAWSGTTIGYIISKPEYMGQKVLGKPVCESYKTKKHRKTAVEERYIFDGAIPVIVDEETWHNAQRLKKTVRRAPKREGEPQRLTGLLYCSDCNSKMTHRYNLVQKKWIDDAFTCSSYRQLTRDCTMHYITTQGMEDLILSIIQRVSWFVRENEKEFVRLVREASVVQQEENEKAYKKQLKQSKKRFDELDGFVKKLIEQHSAGKLSERHYERLMGEYDSEQSALETTMKNLQAQINEWGEDKLKTDKFIELVKRYTDFSELTTPMLNEFIEKVVVYEGDGRGKDRRQRVDIHLNFIGTFEVPAEIITPFEVEEERRQAEELAAKTKELHERYLVRYEKRKAQKRDYTARKKAGLLTLEEIEADNLRLEKNRTRQKEWRDSKKELNDTPPPKKLSITEIAKRRNAGLPVLPDEVETYEIRKEKKRLDTREQRQKKKTDSLPKAVNQ
jgi:hypothetical protein